MSKNIDAAFQALFDQAWQAGRRAGEAAEPIAMVVSQADLNGPIQGGKQWVVPDGPCGFAWVNVKPGNSSFAKWLVRHGLARKDSFQGGVRLSIHDFNQSMTRKEEAAFAVAKVFQDNGVKAFAESRMD